MHERQPPLLERTGRARYAGPTFVVDFARLLELLHDAPDKDQRSRRGVRCGNVEAQGPAGRRGLARPPRVAYPDP